MRLNMMVKSALRRKVGKLVKQDLEQACILPDGKLGCYTTEWTVWLKKQVMTIISNRVHGASSNIHALVFDSPCWWRKL